MKVAVDILLLVVVANGRGARMIRFDQVRATMERIQGLANQLGEMLSVGEKDMAGQGFRGRSDRGSVSATADWQGRPVAIEITRAGVTRSRGSALAAEVVQAVNRARAEARAELQRRMRAS